MVTPRLRMGIPLTIQRPPPLLPTRHHPINYPPHPIPQADQAPYRLLTNRLISMPTTLSGPNMGPTLSLGATSCRPQPKHGQINAFSSTLELVVRIHSQR